MLFIHKSLDCSPLVIDNEFIVQDEQRLAEYVGEMVLGYFAHVKRIIKSLETSNSIVFDSDIKAAINKLTSSGKDDIEIYKRDGWVFQAISWLALFVENEEKNFHCQQPHDAPAQHGLDAVALVLDVKLLIERIVITEDKCTDNHRKSIVKVWKEFKEFENGNHNNKLVSRISALIENLHDGKVLEENQNNIYRKDLRRYRVGINRNGRHGTLTGRKKLFKDYDKCVPDDNPDRRYASTFHEDDIRVWMENFSLKVIGYLESKRNADV